MTRHLSLFAATAVLTVGLSVAAQAQGPAQGAKPAKPGQRMEKMADKLNLTDDQKAKIKAIGQKYTPQLKAIRDNKSLTKEQMRDKARPIMKSMNQEFEAVLTPEQRKKLKALREENRKKMQAGAPKP